MGGKAKMRNILIISTVILTGLGANALAEPIKTSGTVCWTGEIQNIGTSEKDFAFVWTVNWTWISADGDPQQAQTGKCIGSGGLVGGNPKIADEFCIHNPKSGGQFMSTGQSSPQGSKSMMFGGTEQFAGAVGGWTGGPRIDLPSEDGRLAGCRETSGEYTLKE